MVNVFSAAAIILLLLLASSIYRSFKARSAMGNMLGFFAISCAVVVISFVVNLISTSDKVMAFCCCVQNIGVTWSYYFLMRFSFEFTEKKPANLMFRIISVAVLMIDSAIIITTPINEIAFSITIRDHLGTTVAAMTPKFFFFTHCTLCAIVVLTTVVVLAKRIRHAARIYAPQYLIVIATTLFMALPAGVYAFENNIVLDYSVFFFGIAGIFLYHAAYVFPAMMIIGRAQGYLTDVMPGMFALYDNGGVLINKDDRSYTVLGEEFPGQEEKMRELLKLGKLDTTTIMHNGKEYSVKVKKILDEKGLHVLTAFIFNDVTENSILLEKEHKTAILDKLTGINNRAGFFEEAEEYMRGRDDENCYAVMISGINNFRDINRLYGTKTGDDVLREIARELTEQKRRIPIVFGRIAEGKFTVLAPFDELETVAEAISSLTLETGESGRLHIDMRHGFVVMNKGLTLEEYYELAIVAFVNSKKNEGFNVVEYSNTLAEEQKRRETLIADVRNAMEKKEFVIDLQPHISVKDQRVVGAKAWACWEHPTYGRLDNTEFISLLEDGGFISELNRYVWREACATLERFRGSDFFNGYIAVEMDKDNIMKQGIVDEFDALLKEYDLSPDKFHLVIRNVGTGVARECAIKVLRDFEDRGYYIEEADFGKGVSTVENVLSVPFDGIVISMNVLKVASNCSRPEATVKSFINAFAGMGIDVIAVDINSKEDVELIKSLDIKTAEGTYYSNAVPLKDFVGYVRKMNK